MQIPLALEGLSETEIEMVCEVFRSGQLTMGNRVSEFETLFAKKMGAKHAVMLNSGSSANLLALESLRNKVKEKNLDPRDFFIAVPAVLWPTSLWPIIQTGFKVVVIDTKPDSLEIDFDQLETAKIQLGKRLLGAVLIHPLGKALDLDRIKDLKNNSDFFVLEDNCESIGSGKDGTYAGTIGDFGSFSFYYSHHITTVEGGMITTNSSEYANELLSMRAHGWTRNRLDRSSIEKSHPNLHKEFLFVTSGYNLRPMEFQGALGVSQLSQLDNFIQKRIENANIINDSLQNSSLELIANESLSVKNDFTTRDKPVPHSWMALPLRSKIQNLSIKKIQDKLNSLGISTRPLLAGDFTAQPAGLHHDIIKHGELNNSKELYANSFMIGNHHNYSENQINYLASTLKEI